VGGIKHKLLAAYRAGINDVIVPRENEKDLEDLPDEVRQDLETHLVERMDEVLSYALDGGLVSLPQGETGLSDGAPDSTVESGPVAH
jgi:ATP-dependent Lon protease